MTAYTARWTPDESPLEDLDDAALEVLLRARPDLADPPPPNLATLRLRAAGWASILACYRTLDLASQQVMQALSLLPATTTIAALADLLGADATEADLGPVLDRLADRALLTRAGGLTVAAAWHLSAPQAGLGPPLAELLDGLKGDDLRSIAASIGAASRPRNADTAASIREVLLRPGQITALVGNAPEAVVALMQRLSAGPPTVEDTYSYSSTVQTPVAWLRARGLVIGPRWGRATMPREVAIALRGGQVFPDLQLTRPPLSLRPVEAEAVDAGSCEQARQLTHDVLRIVEELELRPGTLLKSGGLGVRDVRRIATLLGRSERIAAQYLELAGAAALLGYDSAGGRVLVGPGFDAWREADTPARWLTLVQAWLQLPHRLSLAGALDERAKPVPPLVRHRPDGVSPRQRQVVLATLGDAPVGMTIPEESFVDCTWWASPSGWDDTPTTVLQEFELLGLAYAGALGRLGYALALEGPVAAAQVLAGWLPPVITEFVLQGDFTAIATAELAAEVRRDLELMADRESSGGAAVYRFSPDTVRRAFDQGWDGGAILTFLRKHAPRGLPQALEYLITDLDRRYGHLRLRAAGCYVRSDDTTLLTELSRARALTSLGLSLIAPNVLIAAADEDTVLTALRAQGYLPALEGPDGATRIVLADRPRGVSAGPGATSTTVDLAALVAGLRAAPAESTHPDLRLVDDDDPVRPTFSARDLPTKKALLALAVDQEWAVGITVGRHEIIVLPYETDEEFLYGEIAVTAQEIELGFGGIVSVRILDALEEARTFLG